MKRIFSEAQISPLIIMIAASLWAIDGIFRAHLTFSVPSGMIVVIEHTIGFIILSPFLYTYRLHILKLKKLDWILLLLLTLVSSVLGTYFFTQALAKSFAQNDFITPILTQKLQPIIVVILSAFFLKEHVSPKFIGLAILALVGSYLMSFGVEPLKLQLTGRVLVYVLAFAAALCWGGGTILSKSILDKLPFQAATVLRFMLAIPVAYIFARFMGQTVSITSLGFDSWWRLAVIAGITGGAGAIFLYYKGLSKTQAKISTFAELMLPLVSLIIALTPLNPYGAPQVLSTANIIGIVILVFAIARIGLLNDPHHS